MSPIVQIDSFRGAMSPQDLVVKAQDDVLGSGMGHRVGFQPSSGGLHHCEHIALALAGLWHCDTVSLPRLPTFIFQTSSIPLRFYPLGLLGYSTCFTFMDKLCDGVHGQVYPSVMSPYICVVSSLAARGVMGPPSYKLFTLLLPVQIHLSHWQPDPPAGGFDVPQWPYS